MKYSVGKKVRAAKHALRWRSYPFDLIPMNALEAHHQFDVANWWTWEIKGYAN
jgi:hypothetical protein